LVAISLAWLPYALHLGVLLAALALFSGGSGMSGPVNGNDLLELPAEEQGVTLGVRQRRPRWRALWVRFSPRFSSASTPRNRTLVSAGIALATASWLEIPSSIHCPHG